MYWLSQNNSISLTLQWKCHPSGFSMSTKPGKDKHITYCKDTSALQNFKQSWLQTMVQITGALLYGGFISHAH